MRKFAAMLILLAYVALCIFLLASFGTRVNALHPVLQLLFYVVAGLIWIAPLRYLFAWLNSGQQPEEE